MHELAHIITKSVGHTDEYWENYRLILKTAVDNDLYKYKNYYEEPVEFCGKQINSTPYLKGGSFNSNCMYKLLLLCVIIGFIIYMY